MKTQRTTIQLDLTEDEAQMLMDVLLRCPYWDFPLAETVYEALDRVAKHHNFGDNVMEYDEREGYFRKVAK